jgi:DNA-binding protein HU-beta
MNRKQTIGAIAEKTGVSNKDVEKVLNGLQAVVGEALAASDSVDLGFVKINRKDKPASKGRNPATKQEIEIPARSVAVAKFMPQFTKSTFEPKA